MTEKVISKCVIGKQTANLRFDNRRFAENRPTSRWWNSFIKLKISRCDFHAVQMQTYDTSYIHLRKFISSVFHCFCLKLSGFKVIQSSICSPRNKNVLSLMLKIDNTVVTVIFDTCITQHPVFSTLQDQV